MCPEPPSHLGHKEAPRAPLGFALQPVSKNQLLTTKKETVSQTVCCQGTNSSPAYTDVQRNILWNTYMQLQGSYENNSKKTLQLVSAKDYRGTKKKDQLILVKRVGQTCGHLGSA